MKTPLKVTISAQHPLLILMAKSPPNMHLMSAEYTANARAMVTDWASLDGLVREHATIQIEGICDDYWRRVEVLLPVAEENGIPITLQTQTNNADLNDTMPMDQVRRLCDQYECIVGLQLSEASHRTFVGHGGGPEYSMGRNARYARDIIRLAGEYGLFMSWQLMSENFAAIGCSADNEALFDTVVEYGEYVIPMHEMNSEYAKYIDHLAAMGFWISGATANWGVEPQSWYWSDAGYAAPGVCIPGSLEMPGELYSIMLLLGATAGATAYSIEPPWDIWPDERGQHRFTDWIVPTFSRLVSERLIPSRSEVKQSMPVAYHLSHCERPKDFHVVEHDLDFDHSEGILVRAAYGVYDRARDAEMIPNNPRVGWIPVLPAKTPAAVLNTFDRVIRPGELRDEDHARHVLSCHFPEVDRGSAWSSVVGPLVVAANSHENWPVPETVQVAIPAVPDNLRFEGNRLIWNRRNGDLLYYVWRFRDEAEVCLTPDGIAVNEFVVNDGATADTGDRYAVSAKTASTETISGTVHLHQFVVFNRYESRLSPWISKDSTVVVRPRFAERLPDSSGNLTEMETRAIRCSPVEDLASPLVDADDPYAQTKRAVLDALVAWKRTIESEDIDSLWRLYDSVYREPDGRTFESLAVAFKSILRKYVIPELGTFWPDFGVLLAWANPVVRLFTRDWKEVSDDRVVIDVVFELWAGGGTELEPSDIFKHPIGGKSKVFRMTWVRNNTEWRIAATDRSMFRMEDVVPFRMRYQGW